MEPLNFLISERLEEKKAKSIIQKQQLRVALDQMQDEVAEKNRACEGIVKRLYMHVQML